jgi:hypothetical protein
MGFSLQCSIFKAQPYITKHFETHPSVDPLTKVDDKACVVLPLKVPKREIFDRSDFPDFYTIKSLRVGDFGVKIKKILQNI